MVWCEKIHIMNQKWQKWQHASYSVIKTITISSEKDSCRSALSLKGGRTTVRAYEPWECARSVQVEIGRAHLQPVLQIHVRSLRSQSMPCLSSSGTGTTRSQAWTHSSERARQKRNFSSREKHNQPPSFFLELTERALLSRNSAHNDIRSQYACANNMLVQLLYESLSTSSTSTSLEEDRWSVKPSLRGEETAGRTSNLRERVLDLVGKEEDRGSPVSIPPPDPSAIPTSTAAIMDRQHQKRLTHTECLLNDRKLTPVSSHVLLSFLVATSPRPWRLAHPLDWLHMWFRAWAHWRCSHSIFRRSSSSWRGTLKLMILEASFWAILLGNFFWAMLLWHFPTENV